MSTKQVILLLQKSALEKLLENKQYFSSGLCRFIAVLYTKSIITYEEAGLLEAMLDSFYNESQDARESEDYYGGYMWEPGEWEPREDWIYSKIKEINVALDVSF